MASVTVSVAEDGLGVGYVQTAIFTVLSWDFLICLEEELKVAGLCGFSPSIVVYYMSRLCNLMLGIAEITLQFAPIAHCQAFWHFMTAMSIIGGAATPFLFFLRVRAVYEKSMPVTITFGIFWLAIPVVCSLSNTTSQATHMGSGQCILSGVESFPSISMWVKAAYDTSVFAAITWRVVLSYTTAGSQRWRLFQGVGLPRIFRDLLRGGQQFYFVTIGVTLMGASAVFLPVDSPHRAWLPIPGIAIESVMACRVFRRLVLSCNIPTEGRSHSDSMVLTTMCVPDAKPT